MAGESGKLQVFWDSHSPPSRAVVILCRLNKIDCEEVHIDLPTGAHKTPEYLSLEIKLLKLGFGQRWNWALLS